MTFYINKLFRKKKKVTKKTLDEEYMKKVCDRPCYSDECKGKLRPSFIFRDEFCRDCQRNVMYAKGTCVYCGGYKGRKDVFCSTKCGKDFQYTSYPLFGKFMLRKEDRTKIRKILR